MEGIFRARERHIGGSPQFNTYDTKIGLQDVANILKAKPGRIRILEIGTKRSNPALSTHHKRFFNDIPDLEYVMTDYQDGLDVDVVSDLHTAHEFVDSTFDLIISVSTYEHLKYPQLVSHNLMKKLKVGGMMFITTHQTFPLHGYKYDYFRFSREALEAIFNPRMNMKTMATYFDQLCVIVPHTPVLVWNDVAESYLLVTYVGEKTGDTPTEYVYDLEHT
jgi:predicted SAM-dependent methyltransferase